VKFYGRKPGKVVRDWTFSWNRNHFKHSGGEKITISGNPGDDAKRYQERDLEKALKKVKK
jgi:hypothetical protein